MPTFGRNLLSLSQRVNSFPLPRTSCENMAPALKRHGVRFWKISIFEVRVIKISNTTVFKEIKVKVKVTLERPRRNTGGADV